MTTFFKILQPFKNKYILAFLAFAILLLFVDHNDIFVQLDRKKQLNDLLVSKHFYENEIAKTKKQLSELQNNSAALEKYAREKFFMKKSNEDLFIVEEIPADSTKNASAKQ